MRNIDVDKLRKEMEDDDFAGAFSGMPAMFVDAWDIERMSDEEVIRKAKEEGIDLSDFEF